MSKTKGTKRKSSTSQKLEAKLSGIKLESKPCEMDNLTDSNDNVKPRKSSSSSSKSYSKVESSVSCTESGSNINVNRDGRDSSSSYMKNDILEEILNAKKAALLQSPAVMKVLRDEQLKRQKK